jgi:hypothetical protein
MMIASVACGVLTDSTKEYSAAILKRVEQLADSLEGVRFCISEGFATDLKSAFESYTSEKIITSFRIEWNEHSFGVDFVLLGSSATQSIFGSTQEWTKKEIDEVLGAQGEEI